MNDELGINTQEGEVVEPLDSGTQQNINKEETSQTMHTLISEGLTKDDLTRLRDDIVGALAPKTGEGDNSDALITGYFKEVFSKTIE